MLAAWGQIDGQLSGNSRQLAGPGVGHDRDDEVRRPLSHRAAVLQDKTPRALLESAGHAFDGHLSRGPFHARACGKHLALAGCFEVAVILFIEQQAAECVIASFVVLGSGFDVEWAGGMICHEGFLMVCGW
jgi:hypothetical protein